MKHSQKILSIFTALVVPALLLTGCFSNVTPVGDSSENSTGGALPDITDTQATSDTNPNNFVNYPAPHIFSRSVQAGLSPRPAEGGGYYYIRLGSNLLYYISEDGTQTVLCGQGGCPHSDDTCPAYYDHLSRFAAHNGKWYVVTEKNVLGGSVELLRVDPSNGKRMTLCRWDADENSTVSMESFLCTDQAVTCIIGRTSRLGDTYTYTGTLDSILTEDGTKTTLRSIDENERIRQMGAVSAGLVLETSVVREEPMGFDAYQKLHPNATENEYDEYYFDALRENTKTRLEIVGSDGAILDVIADSADGYVSSADPYICWNETVVYQKGDRLYCYDTAAKTAEAQETVAGLIGYDIFNGVLRQSCMINDGTQYRYVWRDIHTGETMELGSTAGVYDETDDAFVAVTENGVISILKQDFYRGDYDSAVLLVKNG